MRPSLSLLVALTLFAAGLSGCLGGDEEPAATQSNEPPATPTSVEDLSEEERANLTDDGTDEERGADLGHQPHIHDYWMGRERVTLMDEDVTVDAFSGLAFTFFNTFRGTPGVGGAVVQLPDGQIVYEGTGQLELTVAWTDATVTGMGVQYRSAASTQWSEVQQVTSGTPLVVEVTPEMSDMPHSKTSRWMFLFTPGAAGQSVFGTFHVKVDVIKMRDIDLFPGHPELFGSAHTLELFKGSGTSSQNNIATRIATFATGGAEDDGVASQKVVPMETQSMTANLTIKAASADVGTVSEVYFLVKTADRNGYQFVEPYASDPATGVYQFAWMVEMAQTDSPYADESGWKFDVWVQTDPSGGLFDGSCGGCSNVKVDYDLTVVAYDDVVPDAGKLNGGGRGG